MAKTARAKRKATTSSKKKLPIGLILVGGFSVIVVLLVALIGAIILARTERGER